MLNTLKACLELARIGDVGKINSQVTEFFKSNVLSGLDYIEFFDYLDQPRTFGEIVEHFQFTETELVQKLITHLVKDKILSQENHLHFKTIRPVVYDHVKPQMFTESMIQVLQSCGTSLPGRLKGQFHEFSGGIDLYNWDDTLTTRLYSQIRKGSFAFADALSRKGKLLDVGCGNGFGTAQIWWLYYLRNAFTQDSPMKLYGIDPTDKLLDIAQAEFPRWVKKIGSLSDDVIDQNKNFVPEFTSGKAEQIPYPDNTFDLIYCSATFHWTKADQALKEMVRVAKPGGLIFGTVRMFPHADLYQHFHTIVVENAGGFFWKDDFIRWAHEAGARQVKLGTLVSFFKIVK